MSNSPLKPTDYKVGDYVYIVGGGVGRIIEMPEAPKPENVLLMPKPKPVGRTSIGGALASSTFSAGAGMHLSRSPTKPTFKIKQIHNVLVHLIPENPPNPEYRFRIDPKDSLILKPFTQTDLDEAIRQAGTAQKTQFETVDEAAKYASETLLNSNDLADIGRAYAYAWKHNTDAMRGIVIQAIAILTSVKGHLDFIEKKQLYTQNALKRVEKKLAELLPRPEAPITPLKGQEPLAKKATKAEKTTFQKPALISSQEAQEEELHEYFEKIANNLDQAERNEVLYVNHMFATDKVENLSFKQRYIILHELFGNADRPDIIATVNRLQTTKKTLSEGNYNSNARAAFNEFTRIVENGLSLTFSEEIHEHLSQDKTLEDRVDKRIAERYFKF